MSWLTRYASGKPDIDNIEERVRVIDPGMNERGEPVSVYWEGVMPRRELLAFDPQARCRTTSTPRTQRMIAWWLGPSMMALLVFTAVYGYGGLLPDVLPLALFAGAFLGVPLGLLASWVIVQRWLGPEAWWHFMRIPVRDAVQYGLQPRDESDAWVLWGIVPQPLMAKVEDDGDALKREIQVTLWTNEQLGLGRDGWATSNFLRGMGAARTREELLKAGVVQQPRPTLEKPGPAEKGGMR